MRGKKSASELRAQFNEDVDRFSDLRTAQRSVIDAPLMLRLLAEGAVRLCGACFGFGCLTGCCRLCGSGVGSIAGSANSERSYASLRL